MNEWDPKHRRWASHPMVALLIAAVAAIAAVAQCGLLLDSAAARRAPAPQTNLAGKAPVAAAAPGDDARTN